MKGQIVLQYFLSLLLTLTIANSLEPEELHVLGCFKILFY